MVVTRTLNPHLWVKTFLFDHSAVAVPTQLLYGTVTAPARYRVKHLVGWKWNGKSAGYTRGKKG